ncbi:MAG: UDP-N-acetylglucosamine 1-carboxyvinyltransferase [Flavobacteriales bacterium]|jgi:UDP-N-acetylglucosamine 1-carboxyvinyltransferase|tara:strand:+ start:5786 stop:7090 length:1305 start_codon:yes stop_codon:yes gene_type:complete
MGTFKINGGNRLKGELTPQGAKNEALQVVCAILLTSEKVTLTNLPFIRDVNFLIDLLEALGVDVEREGNGTVHFQANNVNIDYLNSEDFKVRAESLRGSIMIVGPLLARFKKAYMPKPGGDKIGARPLDTHFLGFTKLGATYTYDPNTCFYSLEAKDLHGQYILLDEPSVTGTANILMTSVLAKGKTTIYNAACEPYLQQLCSMLNSMGAKITGVGSNLLHIEGVDELGGCEHRLLPDFIEVGSFIGLAAMTGSEITIKDCRVDMLGRIPETFRRLGIILEIQGDDIYIPAQDSYEIKRMIDGSIPTIYDAVWPGFTPDLLSIVLVTAIQAKGTVLIHQKMFDSRLFFIDRLKDMGAQIILCDPHRATVIGMDHEQNLRGTTMSSPDIRAGVSLLIAALSAEGESTIHNIEQIDRGYQFIDDRLNAIGADITRL